MYGCGDDLVERIRRRGIDHHPRIFKVHIRFVHQNDDRRQRYGEQKEQTAANAIDFPRFLEVGFCAFAAQKRDPFQRDQHKVEGGDRNVPYRACNDADDRLQQRVSYIDDKSYRCKDDGAKAVIVEQIVGEAMSVHRSNS